MCLIFVWFRVRVYNGKKEGRGNTDASDLSMQQHEAEHSAMLVSLTCLQSQPENTRSPIHRPIVLTLLRWASSSFSAVCRCPVTRNRVSPSASVQQWNWMHWQTETCPCPSRSNWSEDTPTSPAGWRTIRAAAKLEQTTAPIDLNSTEPP